MKRHVFQRNKIEEHKYTIKQYSDTYKLIEDLKVINADFILLQPNWHEINEI